MTALPEAEALADCGLRGDRYAEEVAETARAVAERVGLARYEIAYQSAGRTPEPWIGPSLDRVICRCLSFRREDRPDSAEALDAMLEKCAVAPAWKIEDARDWWREKGPAALDAARAQREERDQVLSVAPDSRASGSHGSQGQ